MRIKLKEGKQKELILLAKKGLSWGELSKKINLNEHYLANEIKNEKILIGDKMYKKLCGIADINFDRYIIKKHDDNWGRKKGGLNSKGSTIAMKIPEKNEKLAEFIGVILGDGNINSYIKGKKIRVYQVKIAGDYLADEKYHCTYLKKMCEDLFKLKIGEYVNPKRNERFVCLSSKELVEFLLKIGLRSGDKIKNQITIPEWILENDLFTKACLRGLIDTDGSIFRMSNQDPNLIRISFTNYNEKLLNDTRAAFLKLGYNPSKIINNKQFFISRQSEIKKYIKEIGFSNDKHRSRVIKFSSVV